MVQPDHPKPSLRRQYGLLSVSRSSLYYTPKSEGTENLGFKPAWIHRRPQRRRRRHAHGRQGLVHRRHFHRAPLVLVSIRGDLRARAHRRLPGPAGPSMDELLWWGEASLCLGGLHPRRSLRQRDAWEVQTKQYRSPSPLLVPPKQQDVLNKTLAAWSYQLNTPSTRPHSVQQSRTTLPGKGTRSRKQTQET